jgi:hypothetical protein
MKKRTSVIVGVFFIFLMFGSTLAYTILSAFRTEEKKEEVSLPSGNIVYEELKEDVENFAVSEGRTLIKFYYNALCTGCSGQKTYLESVTSQNSGKILLEELTDSTAHAPKVNIRSQRGSDELVNATNDGVFESLCNLMVYPPVDCALKNV